MIHHRRDYVLLEYKMYLYCRLCLKKYKGMTNIIDENIMYFDMNLLDCIYWIFGVEVDVNDSYSKLICKYCLDIVRNVGYYREAFQKNQLLLNDLENVVVNELKKWRFCDTESTNKGNDIVSVNLVEKMPIPVVNITKLEKSHILEDYKKISDFVFKKRTNENVREEEPRTLIEKVYKDIDNSYIKVPFNTFQNCMSPTLYIEKLETTNICKEYDQINETTYKKIPVQFDVNPDLMQSKAKKLNFIDYYYKLPTSAIQQLIKEKCDINNGDDTGTKCLLIQPPSNHDTSLVKIHDVFHVEVCEYCSKSFKSKQMLKMHYYITHVKKRKRSRLKKLTLKKRHRKKNLSIPAILKLTKIADENLSKMEHSDLQNDTVLDKSINRIDKKLNGVNNNLLELNNSKKITSDYENFPCQNVIKKQTEENDVLISQQTVNSSKSQDDDIMTKNSCHLDLKYDEQSRFAITTSQTRVPVLQETECQMENAEKNIQQELVLDKNDRDKDAVMEKKDRLKKLRTDINYLKNILRPKNTEDLSKENVQTSSNETDLLKVANKNYADTLSETENEELRQEDFSEQFSVENEKYEFENLKLPVTVTNSVGTTSYESIGSNASKQTGQMVGVLTKHIVKLKDMSKMKERCKKIWDQMKCTEHPKYRHTVPSVSQSLQELNEMMSSINLKHSTHTISYNNAENYLLNKRTNVNNDNKQNTTVTYNNSNQEFTELENSTFKEAIPYVVRASDIEQVGKVCKPCVILVEKLSDFSIELTPKQNTEKSNPSSVMSQTNTQNQKKLRRLKQT